MVFPPVSKTLQLSRNADECFRGSNNGCFLRVLSRADDGSNPFTCKWTSQDVFLSNLFYLSLKCDINMLLPLSLISKKYLSIYSSKCILRPMTLTPTLLYLRDHFTFHEKSLKPSCTICPMSLARLWLEGRHFNPLDQQDKCGRGKWKTALDPPLLLPLRCTWSRPLTPAAALRLEL